MHNIVIKTIYIQKEGNIKVNKYFKSSCLFYGSIKKNIPMVIIYINICIKTLLH